MSTSIDLNGPYSSGYKGPINPSPNFDKFEDLIVLYNYIPNLGFNVFATVVWALVMAAHIYRMATLQGSRKVHFMIAFGAAWEVIVYALRSANHSLIYRADLFFAQYAINTVAPILFMAALHNAIGNTLGNEREAAPYLPIKAKFLVYFFGTYDTVVFIITIVGAALFGHAGALLATGRPISEYNNFFQGGYAVLRTGFGNQVACFTLTQGLIVWLFITRSHFTTNGARLPLVLLGVWFLTAGMIWMRSIFRLVTISQGLFGVAWSSETYFGIFEFAPVWLAVAIWAVYPISRPMVYEDTVNERKFIARGSENSDAQAV